MGSEQLSLRVQKLQKDIKDLRDNLSAQGNEAREILDEFMKEIETTTKNNLEIMQKDIQELLQEEYSGPLTEARELIDAFSSPSNSRGELKQGMDKLNSLLAGAVENIAYTMRWELEKQGVQTHKKLHMCLNVTVQPLIQQVEKQTQKRLNFTGPKLQEFQLVLPTSSISQLHNENANIVEVHSVQTIPVCVFSCDVRLLTW